jgi:hypothetical protein
VLLGNLLDSLIERLLISSAHRDAAAFGGEGFGRGQANSLAGRGNQSYAIFQSEIHNDSMEWAL